jgi:ABC-type methionine transport system permease subunit
MHLIWLTVLGTLAAIGALTLIAITYVIRFGDSALNGINSW